MSTTQATVFVVMALFALTGTGFANVYMDNFMVEVSPSAVMVNAHTSFVDGNLRQDEMYGTEEVQSLVSVYNTNVSMYDIVMYSTTGMTYTDYSTMANGFKVYTEQYNGFVAVRHFGTYTLVLQAQDYALLDALMSVVRVQNGPNYKEDVVYEGSNYSMF